MLQIKYLKEIVMKYITVKFYVNFEYSVDELCL